MSNLQELKTITYMMYTIISNVCANFTTCKDCFMIRDKDDCDFHSRIENNSLLRQLFSDKLNTSRCCDDYCKSCELNNLSDHNDTCGFSILSDHLIKECVRS